MRFSGTNKYKVKNEDLTPSIRFGQDVDVISRLVLEIVQDLVRIISAFLQGSIFQDNGEGIAKPRRLSSSVVERTITRVDFSSGSPRYFFNPKFVSKVQSTKAVCSSHKA
jgi:hypothetical protein